jgi:mRNA interferase RelE/StbE
VLTPSSIRFVRSARKELERFDAAVVERLFARIVALAQNPRPAGCKKLRGTTDLWRVRAGDYRIIYLIDDRGGIVEIRAVRHRKDAYT